MATSVKLEEQRKKLCYFVIDGESNKRNSRCFIMNKIKYDKKRKEGVANTTRATP